MESTPVSRDPRLRRKQPSHAEEEPAEEPAHAEEEDVYEMPSDDEEEGEGGPADEEEHPTPQYRGVCWRKRDGRWEAKMRATKVGKNKVSLPRLLRLRRRGESRPHVRPSVVGLLWSSGGSRGSAG